MELRVALEKKAGLQGGRLPEAIAQSSRGI